MANKNPVWDGVIRPGRINYRVSRTDDAFTLVELLVVISIIGLLMGILLPSLTRARQLSKKVVCLSNMRQMGIALQSYVIDNGDRLPPSSCHTTDPKEYWLSRLARHTKETLLFRCPSDKAKTFIDWTRPLDDQPTDARWSSYALNALLDPLCPLYSGQYNYVTTIKRPQFCVYVAESPSSWTNYDHIHPEQWFYNIQLAKGQIAWDRHSGKSNYLFVDGHAETLEIETTYNWPGNCYWYPDSAPHWPPDN